MKRAAIGHALTRSFSGQVATTLAAEVLGLGANFALGVILARLLTPAERGAAALILLLPMTLAYFADLGISQAIVYLLARRRLDPGRVLGMASGLAVIIGGSGALLLAALRVPLGARFAPDVPAAWLLFPALLLPLLLADNYSLSLLRGWQRFDLFNLRRAFSSLMLLVSVAVLLGGLRLGLAGVALAFGITSVLGLLLAVGFLLRAGPHRLHWVAADAGEALRYGLKSYLQNLIGHLHYRLDVYLLAFLGTPEMVAYYAVAVGAAELAFYLPDAVGAVLFPKLSAADDAHLAALTAVALRHTLALTTLAVVGLALIAPFLPLIYGPSYRAAVLPLLILLPGVLAMTAYKVLTRYFSSRGRQEIPALLAGIGLAANVGLNGLLIPSAGASGAAVASMISYGGLALVTAAIFRREAGLTWRAALTPQPEDWLRLRRGLARWGALRRGET